MITIDPLSSEFAANYKLLIGSIVPRPIAVVSTKNEDGGNNLAPFSFFTGVSAKPMIICFCSFIRSSDGEKKDTLKNIEREKEFVINFATEELAEKINKASTELPYGEDEFVFADLTPIDSELVQAPRLKESPIQYECQLRDILSYGDQPGTGTLVTGEVIKIHIDERVHKDGKIIMDEFKPIGRGSGNDWIKTDHRIQMERLMQAQIQK